MKVRAAEARDAAAIAVFWREHGGPTGLPPDVPHIERLMQRDAEALLVAERSGEIVGTLIAGWDGWRFHLYRMAVHPDARRSGVAKALVEAAARRATEVGARRIDARVEESNEGAKAFWEAIGFECHDTDRTWTRPL